MKNPQSLHLMSFLQRKPRGLTVLEVMFAMVVVLVGLVGVAAMVPFAIRQAEDSYEITHGLCTGENIVGVFQSQALVQPRIDAPWQFVDDRFAAGDSALSVARNWSEFYQGTEYRIRFNLAFPGGFDPLNPLHLSQLALLQNQMIGTGFCIDPLFWGYQERARVQWDARGMFRRARFPYYREDISNNFDPLSTSTGSPTPRLRRVSYRDPLPGAGGNAGWLRLAASLQLANVSGGDVVGVKPDEDRSAMPMRGQYVDAVGSLVQSPSEGMNTSWMATLTPSDSTPIITPGSVNMIAVPPPIETFPESYDLSVVVFGKRDVREVLDSAVYGVDDLLPESERIGNMIPVGSDYLTLGTFDIDIAFGPRVNTKVRVGDWVMLSRYVYSVPSIQTPANQIRERHKWYRVINVDDENNPITVRLSGAPWGFTEQELLTIGASPWPPIPKTAVTVVRNAYQVYQRTVHPAPF